MVPRSMAFRVEILGVAKEWVWLDDVDRDITQALADEGAGDGSEGRYQSAVVDPQVDRHHAKAARELAGHQTGRPGSQVSLTGSGVQYAE
jgi:hypothetical protein